MTADRAHVLVRERADGLEFFVGHLVQHRAQVRLRDAGDGRREELRDRHQAHNEYEPADENLGEREAVLLRGSRDPPACS